ncbi:MAG: DUF6179 domain-containing protein [Oscillospiraceae bacterium]
MNELKKESLIKRCDLDEKSYFPSLIENANKVGQMGDEEIEKLQFNCFTLLSEIIERYTKGESGSVPTEVAESIMQSNLYSIGVYLKSYDCPDDAIKALKEKSIQGIFDEGQKAIQLKIKVARHLYHMVLKNMLSTKNLAYTATISKEINKFFKKYDGKFGASETHIIADYPVCNEIENLEGIEFIEKYLEAVYYENLFCEFFFENSICYLLIGYDEKYEDLIFNIFELVLTNAIGCVLCGADIRKLNISNSQIENIYMKLFEKSKTEINKTVMTAYQTIVDEFNITNQSLKEYIKKAMPSVISNIENGVKTDNLQSVFVRSKWIDSEEKSTFSIGEKMIDSEYRELINEIDACEEIGDKIAIIQSEIKSLDDLKDLLLDAQLTENDISLILAQLDVIEIAVLAKRNLYNEQTLSDDLNEKETMLLNCLKKHINSLSKDEQKLMRDAMNSLIINE